MVNLISRVLLISLFAGCTCIADEVDFNRDIRPLLSQNCFACHGPDQHERKGKLRLDTMQGSRKVIEEGDLSSSELIARIMSEDPEERMPPPEGGKKLDAKQVELLRSWVLSGAEYEEPWAYVAPSRSPLPSVKDRKWVSNWIDSFILSALEEEGLKPAPDADPVTLVRRLHFDLTGLPPGPEVVESYSRNTDKEARYEQLVDQLLGSPHFGERMAVYWLDLVRFADTVGYHGDQDHNITPYRDYVIDAFNLNLPFDRFTREQLAGDLLENPTIDQQVATGYNRLLQTSHEGGVQAKEYLAIYAADRIRNLSAVWMGGTLGCAQCHDHKYDPYTTRDFYAMSAFFADIDEVEHFRVGSNSLPTRRPPEIKVLSRRDREMLAGLEAMKPRSGDIEKQIAKVKSRERFTMVTRSIKPRVTRVLPRGNWLDESGEIVEPAVPVFMGKLAGVKGRATRLDLANWLTDVENGSGGLTARVFVNRLWYLFFGEGISRSLDDFGGQGLPPGNPGLLDRLAVEFYGAKWNIKHMVKLLVMSRAYRQGSIANGDSMRVDPLNRFFSRQSRYRLPAEMIRDNALAVGGLLVLDYGGASSKPFQPPGYYRHLNFPQRKYKQHTDSRQYRRGLYVHWQRQFLHPMLKAMDAPSREECTARRPRSNTPTAAMVLLNDPSFVDAARSFAKRIISEGGNTVESRLKYAYRIALSRHPEAEEQRILKKLLVTTREEVEGEDAQLAAWHAVARALLNCSEINTRN
ncbi:MAG: PSD1 and planctomycete cytochrome C domain-containing protein [Verrucomicrobiales bacterium]|nr:PSD1 and planctomycete cytochrome C domain-containing protein [Verrucomicrobiales bacterium]